MRKDLFTIKPSLKQYYGKRVIKDMEFDEYNDDKSVHQILKDLVLTTEITKKSEYNGIHSTEKSVLTQELPDGTVIIWDETYGYILPDREFYNLDDLKEEISQIEEAYSQNS